MRNIRGGSRNSSRGGGGGGSGPKRQVRIGFLTDKQKKYSEGAEFKPH